MSLVLWCRNIQRQKDLVKFPAYVQRFRHGGPATSYFLNSNVGVSGLLKNEIPSRPKFNRRTIYLTSYHLQDSNDIQNEKNLPSDEVCIGEGTWMEIYQGILTAQLKLVKVFSLGTSFVGVMAQPLLYHKLCSINVAAFLGLASFVGFFSFVTPFLIHWVSKKYVIKLEYDPCKDLYAATTLSFFLREHKLHFNVKDVVRPDIPGMFSSFNVHGKPLFVDPEMFKDINHYVRIMGFDKPVDLRMKDFMDSKNKD